MDGKKEVEALVSSEKEQATRSHWGCFADNASYHPSTQAAPLHAHQKSMVHTARVCLFVSLGGTGWPWISVPPEYWVLPPPDLSVLANKSLWGFRAAERWQGMMLDSAEPNSLSFVKWNWPSLPFRGREEDTPYLNRKKKNHGYMHFMISKRTGKK